MSTATTIIEGMVMEGKLDAGETPVLIAGHFTGELNANEVILDPTGVFNGQINANRVELAGNFNGKLITEELSVGATAVIDGDLKSNALVIELGAEVSGTIVLAERRISALTDNLRRGYEAELRVGCTPTLSLHALPQPVADFARDNPAVRLDMRQAHSHLLADMLQDGLLDVVLGPPEVAARMQGESICPLFESPMVILASRYHPLAGRATVSVADLEAARWALHQPGSGIRTATDRLLRLIGVGETLQANELPSNTILSLLRLGDHLAVVPRYVLANTPMAHELVQIDSDAPPVTLAHAAIWAGPQAQPCITRFVDHMRRALAPLGDL